MLYIAFNLNKINTLKLKKKFHLTKYSIMNVNQNIFSFEKFGETVHKKYLGKGSSELGKDLGISTVQATKLRNGKPVGKDTIFLAAVKLNISIDEHLIKSGISK